jgi:hypothetical protein
MLRRDRADHAGADREPAGTRRAGLPRRHPCPLPGNDAGALVAPAGAVPTGQRDGAGRPITVPTYPLRSLITRTPDDPSIALLDAWATVADVLTFYQERIANEGYLRTATERRSVLELGRLVGYRMRPGVAATTYLAYTLDSAAQVTLTPGNRVQSIPVPGELPQTFETVEAIEARGAWNTLQVRQTAPVVPGDLAGLRPGEARPLYFKGTTTGLGPNDAILADFGASQALYRVLEVTPDPLGDRTRVVVRSWQATSTQAFIAPPGSAAALGPAREAALGAADEADTNAIIDLVDRYTALSDFDVRATSAIAQRVVRLLEPLQTNVLLGMTGPELEAFIENTVLREVRRSREQLPGNARASIRLWLDRLGADLGDAVQRLRERRLDNLVSANGTDHPPPLAVVGGLAGPARAIPSSAGASAQTTAATTIGGTLATLALPPSVPPSNSLSLNRSVGATFGSSSDTLPGLLTSMRPELGSVLYQAWRNVPATPAAPLRLYALRARASAFGHNAPPEPVLNSQGAVIGTREWALEKPVDGGALEQFEVVLAAPAEVLSGQAPDDATGTVTVTIGGSDARATPRLRDLVHGTFALDIPGANERLALTLSLPSGSPPSGARLVVTFARRGMTFTTTLGSQEGRGGGRLTWTSDGSDPTSVRYEIVRRGFTGDGPEARLVLITIRGSRPGQAGRVPTEQADVISLDASSPGVAPEGWIAIERPDMASSPLAQRLIISRVVGTREASRADYGLTGKSTFVQLDQPWLALGPNGDTFAVIRGSAVYAQSEPLDLIESPLDPVEQAVCGSEIPLEHLYDGLKPGRWLIVAGERTDVRGEGENQVRVPGVSAVELMMLAGVRQECDPAQPGARTRTTLVLANSLAYCYRRDTLTIHGNVAKATHGETRPEVLGSGDGSRPFQSFVLKQKPLTFVPAPTPSGVESTLKVYVDGVRWDEAESAVGLGLNNHRFVTKTDNDDTTTVLFGNGREGARLPTGQENVTAEYRYGIGKPGNVAAGQLTLLTSRPQGVTGVTNPLRASGGADREGEGEARRNISLTVTSLDRIVSVDDYADFARTFAGMGKAIATDLADGRRRLVHLTIAGADDIPIDPSSDLYRSLRLALRNFGDPYQPFVIQPRRLRALVIAARLKLDPAYLWEKVAPAVRTALLDRFGFARRDLGQGIARSEVVSAIQAVPGVVFSDLDIFDTVDESAVVQQLTSPTPGGLAAELGLRAYIPAALAEVVSRDPPLTRAAELIFLLPDEPETLILSEIAL